MKRKILVISVLMAVIITALCGFMLENESAALSEKLIRLHVIANSDSEEDQALKLRVRDSVLSELSVLLEGVQEKNEAQGIIEESLPALKAAAEEEISACGYNYSVSATIGLESYPTREYETFSLPEGIYTSLKIIIGAGEGHNWWCVVFPPLCTTAALEDADTAIMNLTDDEVSLITEKTNGYIIKFKAVELFGKFKAFFAENFVE